MVVKVVQVMGRAQWQFTRGPSGAWVAWCDPLGLTVEGKTHDDMVAALQEVQNALFLSLLKDGEFERFLLDHGFTATGVPGRLTPRQRVRFEVPWELVRAAQDARAAHA